MSIELALLLFAALGFAYCARKAARQFPNGGAVLTVWGVCAIGIILLAAAGSLAFLLIKTYLIDAR